jgi:hypothetical protein
MWIFYIDINIITRQHLGIFLTIIGTYLLSKSVKIRKQRGIGVQMEFEDRIIDSPTNTYIDNKLFKYGLICVGVGSLLQW